MKFAIRHLVLWPRDSSKSPRVVTFEERGINLVTGGSRSGKSAIIKIIDYCIGSRACNIPKFGPIRRSCEWYGLVVHTEEGFKLIARRDPDDQESTDEYCLIETPEPAVPGRPTKNTNRGAIKGLLDRLARLPQANADFLESGSGYKGRASFGDMTAFLFQPQSVIANDKVLFFEGEDEDHARKLREVFPLVLGVIDAETLVNQHRLAEVRRQLERKRRQRDAIRSTIKDVAGEVRGRFLSAVDLGLMAGDPGSIEAADVATLWARLVDLLQGWEAGDRTGEKRQFASAERVAALRRIEIELGASVSSLRLRVVQVRELAQARQVAESSLERERGRLPAASWLRRAIDDAHACPLCGSENAQASEELTQLRELTASVEAQWQGMSTVPAMLDAEEVELRRLLTKEEERLYQVRQERTQLEQLTASEVRSEEARAVFVGKLQEFVAIRGALGDDSSIDREIGELEQEEATLAALVDADAISQRKTDALALVSRLADHYGRIVELEDENAIINLDIQALTIRVISVDGRAAWLHQIGSGANHLGYHVATLLALHEFFVTRRLPHVPSLLILDQPSQTQFPDDPDEEAEQEEKRAVRKAFEALDSAVERTGVMQVIVSEHAGSAVYDGIQNLKLVERWRRGRKLVPWHWDEQALMGLEGQRAEGAVEDLLAGTILPQLAEKVSAAGVGRRRTCEVLEARFIRSGIRFTLKVDVGDADAAGESDGELRIAATIDSRLVVSLE